MTAKLPLPLDPFLVPMAHVEKEITANIKYIVGFIMQKYLQDNRVSTISLIQDVFQLSPICLLASLPQLTDLKTAEATLTSVGSF